MILVNVYLIEKIVYMMDLVSEDLKEFSIDKVSLEGNQINTSIMEPNSDDNEKISNEIDKLKSESNIFDSLDSDSKNLNEDEYLSKINNLECKLEDMEKTLTEKDKKLSETEARLLFIEQSQINEDEIKNEIMIKVNEGISQLLENEFECPICSEIVVEAAVLNCSHIFCYYCINSWKNQKDECAVCRMQIKNVMKLRTLDSFIDKLLERYSWLDSLELRKKIYNERKNNIL